jgi:four helix bundle protein
MYLSLEHQGLIAFQYARTLVKESYLLTRRLPLSEKYGLVTQINRAAISVPLNIAEGASRKSETERKRYFEIARGSVIEIDTALDLAYDLTYITKESTAILGGVLIKCFKTLSGLIKSAPH